MLCTVSSPACPVRPTIAAETSAVRRRMRTRRGQTRRGEAGPPSLYRWTCAEQESFAALGLVTRAAYRRRITARRLGAEDFSVGSVKLSG